MYTITTEHSFDSAHFLSGYIGKCSNIHGHRWRVAVEVASADLGAEGQLRGMIVDFKKLKEDLRTIVDFYDHALILEQGTLKEATVAALKSEGFRLIPVAFRPTAENFSRHFYEQMKQLGYQIVRATVYETPNNCATYSETPSITEGMTIVNMASSVAADCE